MPSVFYRLDGSGHRKCLDPGRRLFPAMSNREFADGLVRRQLPNGTRWVQRDFGTGSLGHWGIGVLGYQGTGEKLPSHSIPTPHFISSLLPASPCLPSPQVWRPEDSSENECRQKLLKKQCPQVEVPIILHHPTIFLLHESLLPR